MHNPNGAHPMKRLLIALVLATALGTTAVALAAGHGPITEKVLGAASIGQPYTFSTAVALAAGHAPITEKVLGAASIGQPYTFQVQQPADAVVAKATVPP